MRTSRTPPGVRRRIQTRADELDSRTRLRHRGRGSQRRRQRQDGVRGRQDERRRRLDGAARRFRPGRVARGEHRRRPQEPRQVPSPSRLRAAKTSSIEQKSQIAKGGSLQIADAVGLLGGGSGLNPEADGPSSLRRKVSFREEGEIESTKLYAPTPTKRNPQGVGQTSAKYAPFAARGDGGGVPGTINELNDPDFDEAPRGSLGPSRSSGRCDRRPGGG